MFGIIDNSTLTAVQRLMGQIDVKNYYCLDGDILALETLIQAILFNDELYFVDDYKEKYRDDRNKTFSFLYTLSFEKKIIIDFCRKRGQECNRLFL